MSVEDAYEKISTIFNEIQESKNVPNKSIFSLQEIFEDEGKGFTKALEQCYLKILKFLTELKSTPKRVIECFESVTEKLFKNLYKTATEQTSPRCSEVDFKSILEHFLLFFSQGADSPHSQIRLFCSRHLDQVERYLGEKTKRILIEATISLIKEKSALKIIGIKLASFVQHVTGSTLKIHKEALKRELLKAMCSEENKEVRKLAMTNIEMNEENFGDLISRTREVDTDLRILVFRKMIKEKIPLANMRLCDVYKVVYDGLSSRDNSIKDECINYLKQNFYLFEETMDTEKSLSKKNLSKKKRKELLKEIRIRIRNFLSVFQIESSLFYPHIYNILEVLVQEFLLCILNKETLCFYLKEVFEDLSNILKETGANVLSEEDEDEEPVFIEADELFLIRILVKLNEERNAKKRADAEEPELYPDLAEAFSILLDVFPGGVDFCKVIEGFQRKSSCLGLYQSLLIAEFQVNFDEPGRIKLKEVLKRLSLDISNVTVCDPEDSEESENYNDVFYHFKNKTNLDNIWFAQSWHTSPLIRSVDDLVPTMIKILKNITKDNDSFTTEILEVISDLRGPVVENEEGQGDLINTQEEFKRQIKKCADKITEVTEKKNQTKKSKQNSATEDKELELLNQRKLTFESDLAQIQKKIHLINLRALNICNALLVYSKPKDLKLGIENLLTTLIFPMISENDDELECYGLVCLGLICSMYRRYCDDYFEVFAGQANFEKYENKNQASPKLIISLKCLFDFFLVFNLTEKERGAAPNISDNPDTDPTTVLENMIMYLFKAENLVKTLCLEGFCKLLLHNRISSPVPYLTYLLILWHDALLPQNEGYEAIQILTAFFKRFTAISQENLDRYEQSLEMFLNILFSVEKDDLEFDPRFVFYHKSSLYSIIKSSLILLNYNFNKENPNIREFFQSNQVIGAQERFFIFLCNCLKYYQQELFPFYDKLLDRFDFANELRLRRECFHILHQELERVQGLLDDIKQKKQTSNIQKFSEKLKTVVDKINENFGELSAEDRAFCRNTLENTNTLIKDLKSESSTFIKNLSHFELITKKTGTVPDGMDTTINGEFSAMSGSSLLQQKERPKRGGGRKIKVKQDLDESNEESGKEDEEESEKQDNEEEEKGETGNKRKGKKKKSEKPRAQNKKKKQRINPQVSILNEVVDMQSVEKLEGQDEDEESKPAPAKPKDSSAKRTRVTTPQQIGSPLPKKTSATKTRKSPAVKYTGRQTKAGKKTAQQVLTEEIDDDIEEVDSKDRGDTNEKEGQDDDIEEVEENVRTSSGRVIRKPKKAD